MPRYFIEADMPGDVEEGESYPRDHFISNPAQAYHWKEYGPPQAEVRAASTAVLSAHKLRLPLLGKGRDPLFHILGEIQKVIEV
jgi:hypothetical protein